MNNHQPIAHVARDASGAWRDPHDLAAHLAGVAVLAACNARPFGAEDWAHLAGLWHDLGKYRPAFQSYIRSASGYEAENAHIEGAGRVDHSTAGAVHAVGELGEGVRELMRGGPHVQDPNDLYQDLDRVKVHWPNTSAPTTWDELTERVTRHDQTLAIVNRKAHARELAKRLPDTLYLSTDLCGAHRAERIEQIRFRLEANRKRTKSRMPVCSLHVVSTSPFKVTIRHIGTDLLVPIK